MIKKTIISIITLLIGLISFGQNTTSIQKKQALVFTDHKHDRELKIFLDINRQIISMSCNPKINENLIDSLNSKTSQIIDSSNVHIYLKSDSTWIYLKNSYSWNIHNELPKVPKTSVIKYIFKNQEKLTEKEKKLLHYMIFYSNRNYEDIDKFTYYQNYEVESRLFQFRFDCHFDDMNKPIIKLTGFKEIKN
ncbi:hypothetical protein CLV93_103198 [Prolixibacter denitrificans]|uniref:Uncharacterized protein n=1 Tax=Prolixibacter denitrificans TaxID=1541063 RepID=A0A2P8CFL7_9BACT|nr:hypothetical protein CLV93_103198 [Prolixibacter denitrificans]GET23326.1 hypothetical protein JCM18694_35720 [Prolixibacter denitrificans]